VHVAQWLILVLYSLERPRRDGRVLRAIEQLEEAVMIARFLVALLALTFCFKTEAREGWEAFGSGTKSCADWTNAQAERRPISSGGTMLTQTGSDIPGQTQWIAGFLTAFNYYQSATPNVAEGTDMNGVFAWMDTYCAAHPLDPIANAAIALVAELSKRQSSGTKPK
jgi:hypothetical protein